MLIVIELLINETTEKKISKLLPLKTFFFPNFLSADNKSSQKQTHDNVLKNGC